MREFTVTLEDRNYPIVIAAGILDKAGVFLKRVTNTNQVFLVSNPTVFDFYGQVAVNSFREAGFTVTVALMPDGEHYKNIDEAMKILDKAVDANLERSSLLAALGGGVTGDLAGFVASIYQRGVDFVQIPTTLLAQVDSSVGGKVAVNHPRGKNLIGAFHQPQMVIIDTRTLNTLEDREYRAGLGEVVKYGIIYNEDFLNFMEKNISGIRTKDEKCIEQLIYRSCRIKSEIVEKDEKELGLRAILNLGHTFGHSLEKLGKYNTYRHGEAVAMGTIAAAYLAAAKGFMTESEVRRIINLYRELELPDQFPGFNPEDVYKGMLNDKKIVNKKLRLVLPRGIGSYVIADDITEPEIIRAIEKAQKGS